MDDEIKNQIDEAVKQYFKHGSFTDIKRTDTPTDRNQVVPKGYVDDNFTQSSVFNSYFTNSVLNEANGGTGLTSNNAVVTSMVAGESLTAGNALMVATGTFGVTGAEHLSSTASGFNAYGNNWNAQTFYTTNLAKKIKTVDLYLGQFNSPAGNFNAFIYETSGGNPSSAIGSASIVAASVTSDTFYTLTYPSPVTVSPSVLYAIVATVPSGNINNAVKWFTSANTFSQGTALISTDGGSSWTDQTPTDFTFRVTEIQTVAGYVYKSNASANNEYANNFVGFSRETVSSVQAVKVDVSGVNLNQSSLVSGATYYMSSVSGAISSFAGTQSRKIGLALEANKILIKHDNP